MHELNNITIAFFFFTKIESAARPLWNRLDRLDTFKKLSNSVSSFTLCNHEIILVLVIPFEVVAVLEQVLLYLCC